jgi:hypothetical protein
MGLKARVHIGCQFSQEGTLRFQNLVTNAQGIRHRQAKQRVRLVLLLLVCFLQKLTPQNLSLGCFAGGKLTGPTLDPRYVRSGNQHVPKPLIETSERLEGYLHIRPIAQI